MIRYYIHNSPFGPRRGRLRQRAAKTHVDIWLMDILFNKQDIQCCYLLCFPVPLDDFSVLSTTVTTYPPSVATFMNIGESGIFSSISLSSCKSYTSTNVLPFSMRWTQLLAPLGRALWSESRLRAMVQKKCHTLSRRSTFAMTAQHKTQKKHRHKEWLLYKPGHHAVHLWTHTKLGVLSSGSIGKLSPTPSSVSLGCTVDDTSFGANCP